ncbi:hypothetical protein GCWU000324_01728 [Kingella oralis ATCC 51147]|uniref:Uncharacterized protein n=1 Tax=Kingella oralis ATCC 51147 TaxID=629741 RepID=C4GL71_9NEIS|nr:hypothetical protein GCWU000324_01728 [Kingella oralis ATCC 51147]
MCFRLPLRINRGSLKNECKGGQLGCARSWKLLPHPKGSLKPKTA